MCPLPPFFFVPYGLFFFLPVFIILISRPLSLVWFCVLPQEKREGARERGGPFVFPRKGS